MKEEKSCGCIIIENNKVLLVYEKGRNFWGFPKGHVEENETEIQTAIREVKEEVNLDVKINENKRYVMNYLIGEDINKTTVLYLAEKTGGTLKKQEDEIGDAKWCNFDEALELLTFDNSKKVLKEVIETLKS